MCCFLTTSVKRVAGLMGICLFFAIRLNAQTPGFNYTGERMNLLSPQTSDFIKYGNNPISHFTGETNVKIPLYTYKDQDFELPIFIGYNSAGFNPNKREGIVGLSWFLNTGGVITRKVNGVPDELSGSGTATASPVLHGYYYGIKNNKPIKALSPADIFNCNACFSVTSNYYVHNGDCEMQPDEFSFSMPGHSGDFVIKNSRDAIYGDARCMGNQPYYIDLSGLTSQSYNWTIVQFPSIIKITAPDGYLYEFGGSYDKLEISYKLNANGESQAYPTINAWHLTKITAPSGRVVLYKYKQPALYGLGGYNQPPKDRENYYLNIQQEQFGNALNATNTVNGPPWSSNMSAVYNTGGAGFNTTYEATKTVYLQSIIIDNTQIGFSYGLQAHAFYSNPSLPGATFINNPTLQLNGLSVYYNSIPNTVNDDPVKAFAFGYTYKGGTFGRNFLTSVQESGSEPYTFTYYRVDGLNNLPNPLTHGIDYWGFWNGGTNIYSDLIPTSTFHENGDLEYNSPSVRDPTNFFNVALLEKITYPTKGTTTFFYEPHTYSQRLERRSVNNFFTALYPVTGIAGGARIRKIVDSDGLKNQNDREFYYTKNYPGTVSSGILLDWPRYLYYWKFADKGQVIHNLQKKSTSFHSNYYPGEKYIQYAEVIEKTVATNGYTQYKFTNYATNPDSLGIRSANYSPTYNNITPETLYNNFIGLKFNNRSFERGKPREVTDHALVNGVYQPVRKKTTGYTKGPDYPTNYLAGILTSGAVAECYKIFTYPFLPAKEVEITYNTDFQAYITTTTTTTYNALNLPSQQAGFNSSNEIIRTRFKYPLDYTSTLATLSTEANGIRNLQNRHIFNAPVEQYTQILNANNSNLRTTGAQIYTYTANTTKPDKLYKFERNAPDPGFTESGISSTGSLIKDDNYQLKASFYYSPGKENLIQISQPFSADISYIWENNGLYPIAEAENAAAPDIAYCGFEENTIVLGSVPRGSVSGGWSSPAGSTTPLPAYDAKLGEYGWPGALQKTITKPSVISVWAKLNTAVPVAPAITGYQPKLTYATADGWKFYQWEITTPGTFILNNNGAVLDEARCYPLASRIKTYTYKPLVGQTSSCDFNSFITRYFYDGYNRLYYIKDDKGNILKQYDYYFAQ
jgi:hypothetical protein